jgi:carboxypeptidase C (cathepsin A)
LIWFSLDFKIHIFIILFSESHAGHYIPSMMQYILQRNDNLDKSISPPRVKINLRGGAIGNGWVDPYYQYAAADLAFSIGMIDRAQKENLDKKEEQCRMNLDKGNYKSTVCYDLLDDIVNSSGGTAGQAKVSIYDNRMWEKRGQARSFPPGHMDVERYLGGLHNNGMKVNYQDVLRAIHAEESISVNQQFQECTDPPYLALANQDGLGVTKEVVQILEHHTKPKLLFFNGMNDMICNHIGNEKFLDNLDWLHTKDWILAKRYAWGYDSAFIEHTKAHGPTGYIKEYDNLAFLKIASSGHMVPMDLPDVALEMMRNFMFQVSFGSNYQNLQSMTPQGKDDKCITTSSTSSTKYNGDDDEEAEDSRQLLTKQFISGGSFGVAIGMTVMVLFNIWSGKPRTKKHELVLIGHDSEEGDTYGYSDDPETELVISPTRKRVVLDGELT